MFDTVTGSTYDGSYSDKAEMIADVLKFFGIQNPKQAVYIGDSITDYIGAKKAGTDFIAALYDRSPDEFLSADILMPAYEVNDIYGYLKL
jgi:phosphoglycolate phosphatase-like HAD superfamily hydrolase